MATYVKKSSGLKIVAILLLVLLMIGGLFVFVYFAKPDFVSHFADQVLQGDNAELKDQLNQTQEALNDKQRELDAANDALLRERGKRLFWTAIVALFVIGILVIVAWYVLIRSNRGLTMEEAERIFKPKARLRYGFSAYNYPMIKITSRSYERVKKGGQNDKDERMFFIEMEFIMREGVGGYVRGLRAYKPRVVTVVLLNFTWQVNQQWYPFTRIDDAVKMAHEHELWGFGLQKSRLEDDIRKAVEDAASVQEIKKSVETDAEEATG